MNKRRASCTHLWASHPAGYPCYLKSLFKVFPQWYSIQMDWILFIPLFDSKMTSSSTTTSSMPVSSCQSLFSCELFVTTYLNSSGSSPGNGANHSGWDFPPSSPIKTIPTGMPRTPVSQVVPDLIKLTIEVNHHNHPRHLDSQAHHFKHDRLPQGQPTKSTVI